MWSYQDGDALLTTRSPDFFLLSRFHRSLNRTDHRGRLPLLKFCTRLKDQTENRVDRFYAHAAANNEVDGLIILGTTFHN